MTSVEPSADTATPATPATPDLADKLSALVARTQRPAAPVVAAETVDGPSLADLTTELRGDLLSELGDLRAEIAAVGDEATEASGRINSRAHEIAESLAQESGLADGRSARVEERLDALEAKVDAFALDLSAALRTEGQRTEAALRTAIEEAALVLAETLLMALPAAAPAPVSAPTVVGHAEGAAAEEPLAEEPVAEEPVEVAAEPVVPGPVLAEVEEPTEPTDATEPTFATESIEPIEPTVAPAPASFSTPAPESGRGFFGRSRR